MPHVEAFCKVLILRLWIGVNHDADDHALPVGSVAPSVIDALYDSCIAGLEQCLVCIGHKVDLTICNDEHIARICTMHAWIAPEIPLGRRVLLLHLCVQILQDLDVLPCVLDVGRITSSVTATWRGRAVGHLLSGILSARDRALE